MGTVSVLGVPDGLRREAFVESRVAQRASLVLTSALVSALALSIAAIAGDPVDLAWLLAGIGVGASGLAAAVIAGRYPAARLGSLLAMTVVVVVAGLAMDTSEDVLRPLLVIPILWASLFGSTRLVLASLAVASAGAVVQHLDTSAGRDLTDAWLPVRIGVFMLIAALAHGFARSLQEARRGEREAFTALLDALARDPLTGLANRRELLDRLGSELARSLRDGGSTAVVFVAFDAFSRVGERYGQPVADALLRAAADRLRTSVRVFDVAARWDGGEFCLLVCDCADAAAARGCAERALSVMREPYAVSGHAIALEAFAGVARSDRHSGRELLVSRAYGALRAAPRHGGVAVDGELTVDDLVAGRSDLLRQARTLGIAMSLREGAPESHCWMVASLAEAVAEDLGLEAEASLRTVLAGWLHDVGKVAIPDALLGKRTALTADEWVVMKSHAEVGARMLAHMPGFGDAAHAVHYHHERWDGGGYPDGLDHEGIPVESRILAVCDAYSAMTEERTYQAARSSDEALELLRDGSGSHWDPACVEAICRVVARRDRSGAQTLLSGSLAGAI